MKAILKKEFTLGYVVLIVICLFAGFAGGNWYVHRYDTTIYPDGKYVTCREGYSYYAEPYNRCVPDTYYNNCFGGVRVSNVVCPL